MTDVPRPPARPASRATSRPASRPCSAVSSSPRHAKLVNGGRGFSAPVSPRSSRPSSARSAFSASAPPALQRALLGVQPEAALINVSALLATEQDYQAYCMRTCWLAIPGALMVLAGGKQVPVVPREMRSLACNIADRFNELASSCTRTSVQLAYACLQRSLLVSPKDAPCHAAGLFFLGTCHLQENQPSYYNPGVAARHLRRAAMVAESYNASPSLRARIYASLSTAFSAIGSPGAALAAQENAVRAAKLIRSGGPSTGRFSLESSQSLRQDAKDMGEATSSMSFRQEVEAAGAKLPDENEIKALCRIFNERIDKILATQTVLTGTWSTLFKDFDNDQSGLITFDELKSGVRERLKLTTKELPSIDLKALWVVLDTDVSGYIESSEFQKFMKRDVAPPMNREQRTQVMLKRRQTQRLDQEVKAQQELLLDGLTGSLGTKEMKADLEEAGRGVPTPEETVELAVWWAKQVAEYKPGVHRGVAWLKVFKEVDNDHSGLITFDELKHVVRQSFKVTRSAFSDLKLKQLWCAVDTDESDSIAQVEFGRFVKLAKDHDVGGDVRQMKYTSSGPSNEQATSDPVAQQVATDTTSFRQDVEAAGKQLPDENAVRALSRTFNERIDKITGKSGTWSTLFKDFDNDQSGLITFDELKSGVRERLKLTTKELPSIDLKALWVVLDTDVSGYIESSEFQKFMKRDVAPPMNREQRTQVMLKRRQTQRLDQEVKAQQELLLDGLTGSLGTKEMKADLEEAGRGVPTPEETVELAVWWAKQVAEYKPGVHRGVAWLKVFKEVDNDHSGLITFDELKHVVRQSFKVTRSAFSDLKLKQLWCAVDTDESDSIAQVEFGRFVKLAKDHDVGGDTRQMKYA